MEPLHQPNNIIAQKYKIINTLGEGGSGITYLAQDLQNNQNVALKALSLHRMTDWKAMELFEREAKILAQLNHPAIPDYLEYFDADQLKVCFYEEFSRETERTLADIFRFLDVDENFTVPDLRKANVSGIPKSRFIYNLFRKDNVIKDSLKSLFSETIRKKISREVLALNLGSKPELKNETRQYLINIFREDITSLEEITKQDLSHWLI